MAAWKDHRNNACQRWTCSPGAGKDQIYNIDTSSLQAVSTACIRRVNSGLWVIVSRTFTLFHVLRTNTLLRGTVTFFLTIAHSSCTKRFLNKIVYSILSRFGKSTSCYLHECAVTKRTDKQWLWLNQHNCDSNISTTKCLKWFCNHVVVCLQTELHFIFMPHEFQSLKLSWVE